MTANSGDYMKLWAPGWLPVVGGGDSEGLAHGGNGCLRRIGRGGRPPLMMQFRVILHG
ncbi:hypothetical protein [Streptomyces sp. NPDC007088]|uniref:hypothetical protein n=1 Tax=Streptomyces sp. NPDC007088 TaxID=3364773 RepID=UPI003673B843